MNPIYFFIIFLANCNAFTKITIRNNITPLKTFESIDNFSYTERYPIIKKINGFTKLIRPTNIIPTIFLGISSGFIMNPSFHALLKCKPFILSNAIILLIMSNSMIINDLFDIHVDRKNNPSRPLVTGVIKKRDAIIASLFLFGLTEYLNIKGISSELRIIPRISNLIILFYTPLLKRIPFIKNVSCSLLVSFSVLFTGLCADANNFFMINKNFALLALLAELLFTGSFYNELLLDISDISGDKINRIYTMPVLVGEKETLKIIGNVTVFNILWCAMNLTYMFDIYRGMLLFFLCFPFLKNLVLINDSNYSKESIKYAVKETIKPMVSCLLYLCLLSLFH